MKAKKLMSYNVFTGNYATFPEKITNARDSMKSYLHSTPIIWQKRDDIRKLFVQLSIFACRIFVGFETSSKKVTGC